MCGTIKKYIVSRTSKPVSRLIKASCNPLSADEILSIIVPINVRCSSEIAESGLHEAFMSLLIGFEVHEMMYIFDSTAHF